MMRILWQVSLVVVLCGAWCCAAEESPPTWTTAADRDEALSADETRAFMKTLAKYVVDHHLKQVPASPQRGLIYEYFDTSRAGQDDCLVQGEALDTMHDGAWFCLALVNAYRATGDRYYLDLLTDGPLPFYLKMLNHSDELFRGGKNCARADKQDLWKSGKEWLLQPGEKGFVPYWWDDGYSVSLEQRSTPGGPVFPCYDEYVANQQPNPQARLKGYSWGSSNHLAQDLGVMLQGVWLLLREQPGEKYQTLTVETAEAIKNLHQCRMNHHGYIPAVVAPLALVTGDENLFKRLPNGDDKNLWKSQNHFVQALLTYKPGQRVTSPGFADDQEYHYYVGIARHRGTLPRPLAFKLTYDAFTQPILYQLYCDDAPVPPGINRFDLHPYQFVDGKPVDVRSERKGPGGKPRPAGSRFGPQNMIVCGWALQALAADPGLWTTGIDLAAKNQQITPAGLENKPESVVVAWLRRELGGGLRTWKAVYDTKGYIPTSLGAGSFGGGYQLDNLSDTGGYAHLISAGSQWLYVLAGKRDWEQQHVPAK